MNKPSKSYNYVFIITLLIVNVVFTDSCTTLNTAEANKNAGNTATNAEKSGENSAAVKDNVDELLEIIRLPEIPEEVLWKQGAMGKADNRVPGPTDKKLIAVLRYKPETTAKIIALVEKNKTPQQNEINTEPWFPEELIAQSQLSGNESLKGTVYGANDFFNIPYGEGTITRIEGTDYFVLELFAF